MEEGLPITSPAFYAHITPDQATRIFRPDDPTMNPMPLLEERIRVMQKAGSILVQKFQGSFVNCVEACDGSAQALIQLLMNDFEDIFNDSVTYKDRQVFFMKRAQIVVADIWACFDGQGLGKFKDIDTVTIFADYRIPQALVYFGVLEYSQDLMNILWEHQKYHETEGVDSEILDYNARERMHTLPYGSPLEVQIRGCSIWAIELLRDAITKKLQSNTLNPQTPPNAILIDFYIWDFTTKHKKGAMQSIPFHRTRSIYY